MINETAVDELKYLICDRLTPEELIEALGVNSEEIFEKFRDEILELDLSEILSY